MASVFRDQGLIEDARSTIERAIAHNPQSFKLLFEALIYYDEQQQIEKLQAFFSTTMQQVENKEDFYRYFVLFCCENELYDYAIEVLEPVWLREEMADIVKRMWKNYEKKA